MFGKRSIYSRWPPGLQSSFWRLAGLPVTRDSSTAVFDGSPSGCLAWPLTPCFPELAAFLHGQVASVHELTPAALVELTRFPEVRMAKWVIDGSRKPREVCACWILLGLHGWAA